MSKDSRHEHSHCVGQDEAKIPSASKTAIRRAVLNNARWLGRLGIQRFRPTYTVVAWLVDSTSSNSRRSLNVLVYYSPPLKVRPSAVGFWI